MTEEYNGWSNMETWALNLQLSNDEGFYHRVNELMAEAKQELEDSGDDTNVSEKELKDNVSYILEQKIKDYVEQELKDFSNEIPHKENCNNGHNCIHDFFNDIGSLWRVDYQEVARAWLDE